MNERLEFESELRVLAGNYNRGFPKRPVLIMDKGWLYGIWVVGQHYASGHGYYGEYPAGYLKRLAVMFSGRAKVVLHAFAGVVEKGLFEGAKEYTLDVNPALKPDVISRVEDFSSRFRFDLILADPPYTKEDAKRYGFGMPNRRKSVAKLADHLVAGGYLCWLDIMPPQWKKANLLLLGTIGIVQSSNHRVRLLSIFRKNAVEPDLDMKE